MQPNQRALLFAAFLFSHSSLAASSLEWSERYVYVDVGQGRSTAVVLYLESNRSIKGLELSVVPELVPFLTVSPKTIDVEPDSRTEIRLDFIGQVAFEPGIYEGTVRARQGGGRRTFAKPLPVSLELRPSFESPGLSIVYPIGSEIVEFQHENSSFDRSVAIFASPESITGPTLNFLSGVSLDEYLDSLADTAVEVSRYQYPRNGIDWLVAEFLIDDGADTSLSALAFVNGELVQFVAHERVHTRTVFFDVLDSLRLGDF